MKFSSVWPVGRGGARVRERPDMATQSLLLVCTLVLAWVLPSVAMACARLQVSDRDFSCAGFSRNTRNALAMATRDMRSWFCNRQEIAMFLGQMRHEGGLDPTRQLEFCALRGTCDLSAYNTCSWNPRVRPAPGQHYRGRGPIQLSYSCNYKAAGDALGVDLLSNPGLILSDDQLSWKTALWYWNLEISGASAHTVAWKSHDFASTTRKINGALECDSGPSAQNQIARVRHYQNIAKCMGLRPINQSQKLFCSPNLSLEDPFSESCTRIHTVQRGDSCYNLWRANSIPEQTFRALNPGIDCALLQIGQRVCVGSSGQPAGTPFQPAPAPSSPRQSAAVGCTRYHTIVAGDLCYMLWNRYGITQQLFYSLNPAIACRNLRIGSRICVAGTSTSSPMASACRSVHRIVAGDTCYALWTRTGITESRFRLLNPGVNCSNLRIGDTLCLS